MATASRFAVIPLVLLAANAIRDSNSGTMVNHVQVCPFSYIISASSANIKIYT